MNSAAGDLCPKLLKKEQRAASCSLYSWALSVVSRVILLAPSHGKRSALILHSRLGYICLERLLESGLAVTPKLVDLGYEGHHYHER